jgi:aminoglycoside 2'-N-acetyltransferase I
MATGGNGLVRSALTSELPAATLDAIHALMVSGFEGDFSDDDWTHTIGGRHFFIEQRGSVLSHAAVVPRPIEVSSHPFRTGYVEGVATHPERRHEGLGSGVMSAAFDHIRSAYELGALGTDVFEFYARLGWERWQGPTFVRESEGLVHTKDDDGYVMVLRFGPSETVDLTAPISCDARPGDDW